MTTIAANRPVSTDVKVSRVYDAAPEAVFRAWTSPERFLRWFGPVGSTMPFCAIDARPGGVLRCCHRIRGVADMWVKGSFREVSPNERLVFTVGFTDAAGRLETRQEFPRESEVCVSFEGRFGKTVVTVEHRGLERDQGERAGWSEALERLATYVRTGGAY